MNGEKASRAQIRTKYRNPKRSSATWRQEEIMMVPRGLLRNSFFVSSLLEECELRSKYPVIDSVTNCGVEFRCKISFFRRIDSKEAILHVVPSCHAENARDVEGLKSLLQHQLSRRWSHFVSMSFSQSMNLLFSSSFRVIRSF